MTIRNRRSHLLIIRVGLASLLILSGGISHAASVSGKGAWSSHFGANPSGASAGFAALKLDLSSAKMREAFIQVMGRTALEPQKLAEKADRQPAIVQQELARYGKDLVARLRLFASGQGGDGTELLQELKDLNAVGSLLPEKQRPELAQIQHKIDLQFAINPVRIAADMDGVMARVLRTSGFGKAAAESLAPKSDSQAQAGPVLAAAVGPHSEPDFALSKPVVASNGQENQRLRVAPFDGMATSVVYGSEGLLRPDGGPVVILFAGTGANSKKYGIGPSMESVANKLLKLGASPIGFQNPFYHHDDLPDDQRRPIIERYGSLDAQADWMAQAIQFVVDRIPQGSDGRPSRPVIVGTRSTGSGLFLQLTHDLIAGRPRARVLEKVTAALLMGVLGHTEAERSKWNALELKYLEKTPGLVDLPVQEKGTAIYEKMDWAPEGARAPLTNDSIKSSPKLVATIGANDDQATPLDQMRPLERLAAGHPQLDVTLLGLDTMHNPANEVAYPNRQGATVKVEKMHRLGPILESLLLYPLTYSPGLRFHAHPAFWDVAASDEVRSREKE